jgi:ABC-type polysaccharide/polyol phosphate export permease
MLSKLNKQKAFAELVLVLSLREIKGKYKGSLLGPLWVVLYPLFLTAITTLVFSLFIRLSSGDVPYSIFALSGLIIWNFFSKTLSLGTKSLNFNRDLIVETSVTAEAIPLSYIIGHTPDVFINLILLLIVILFSGFPLNPLGMLFIPIFFLLLVIFIYGLSMLFSTLNVMYKDTQNLLDPILLVGFYLTPIVYSVTYVPKNFQWLLLVNPIAVFIEVYRKILLMNSVPSLLEVGLLLFYTLGSFLIGKFIFKKFRPIFADVI